MNNITPLSKQLNFHEQAAQKAFTEESFSAGIKKEKAVQEINYNNIAMLKVVLQKAAFDDPFLMSPAYYGLTGRRGLWIYAKDNGFFLFCLHPNIRNKIIVFPPFGIKAEKILNEFLCIVDEYDLSVQLSRASDDCLNTSPAIQKLKQSCSFEKHTEEILDWKYPAHIISCRNLIERKGKEYALIRQPMNKFSKTNLTSRSIDFAKDTELLLSLSTMWNEKNTDYYKDYEFPSDYFRKLTQLGKNDDLDINGVILLFNQKALGFSIWENPVPNQNTANVFASQLTTDEHTNLCTYLIVKSCEAVFSEKTEFICLGGSETEGLDRFKRKFVPSRSISLNSVSIKSKKEKDPFMRMKIN